MRWIFCLCILFTVACSDPKGVQIPKNKKGFEKLSEYQLFQGVLADLNPIEHLIPYDLNTPLFSDYAQKLRFVWIPQGFKAKTLEDGSINFPIGTVLVKNFFYENDGVRNIIETRLLIKYENEWVALPYIWNKEQTEAFLEVAGGSIATTFQHQGETINFKYSVPNKNQCKSCHNINNTLVPIGPKISNLNKAYTYLEGSWNQIDYWVQKDILDFQHTEKTPVFPDWENTSLPVADRAKAYLEVNCGHCHQAKGPANTSGLFLQMHITNETRWGICKTPVAAGRGSGGRKVAIQPGEPDASILLYRMDADDPGIMMPEIGRKLIHKEAVALIREWIGSMESTDCHSSISATITSSSSIL